MVVLLQNTFLASKKLTTQEFPKPEALSLYLVAFHMFCSFVNYLTTF